MVAPEDPSAKCQHMHGVGTKQALRGSGRLKQTTVRTVTQGVGTVGTIERAHDQNSSECVVQDHIPMQGSELLQVPGF